MESIFYYRHVQIHSPSTYVFTTFLKFLRPVTKPTPTFIFFFNFHLTSHIYHFIKLGLISIIESYCSLIPYIASGSRRWYLLYFSALSFSVAQPKCFTLNSDVAFWKEMVFIGKIKEQCCTKFLINHKSKDFFVFINQEQNKKIMPNTICLSRSL